MNKSKPFLDQTILKSLLHYEAETGVFTWRYREDILGRPLTRYNGKRAGNVWSPAPSTTYWSIYIFNWPFLGHRLATLYMTGAWPSSLVDHKDNDGTNNAWSNLRQATRKQNAANSKIPATNTSGLKGASFSKKEKCWIAQIRAGGTQTRLGRYTTAEAAHAAYCAAAEEYRGEFARFA